MNRERRARLGPFLLLTAAILAGSGAPVEARCPRARSSVEQTSRARCIFSNPAFSGHCTETVDVASGATPDAACRSVLACLNDTRCLKTYCSATTIRSGWKLESATVARETPR